MGMIAPGHFTASHCGIIATYLAELHHKVAPRGAATKFQNTAGDNQRQCDVHKQRPWRRTKLSSRMQGTLAGVSFG
jgi:hypothetical protein